ncbi:ABC transporter permease [Wenxinia marina]|uniref:ABC-type dipeptide/oligopeptide/nickel transport system, permease component n=1 Tax=Wenxinia marina DSM 24838 TaxID=1123501 RepID=A0A0D0QBF1_9RHOB|nr:ABC transporter permease [Wenxinia marina]KIQ68243.1 ABC-type dipeptide/oligopeptide/nickel transport system, permease component [Wenxinia marina DSM 24838]GGL77023.1 peptide ABC transporter permease [Wenxinia marina]
MPLSPVADAGARRDRRDRLRRFLSDWQAVVGLALVILFVASAVFAPWIAPYDPNAMDIPARMSGPSWAHLAGTDQLGRDTFSRILHGGRVALLIAAIGVSVSLVVGLILGMIAGFGPRWLDSLLLLVFDGVRSFPSIILALATVALTGPSLTVVLAIVIITSIPGYARVARTATLALRHAEFILAERSLGAGTTRILLHHMMPNVIGPLLILAAMDVPVVVSIEAGLSFLGIGVLPPRSSWGTILNEGYLLIRDAPWMVVAGGIPLILTTLGFTFLGEALRDTFDPRMGRER